MSYSVISLFCWQIYGKYLMIAIISLFFFTFAARMVYIDDCLHDFDLATALQNISEQRREQALRFKFELGQRQCVLAYQLLKRALREEYGLTGNPLFEYGEHGKPTIVGHPEIFFNLSHCREAVACVVSDRPVGIDVESIRSYNDSLVRYTMSEEEVARIEASEDPSVAFIRLWTMKEALLKQTGTGICDNMKTVLQGSTKKYTTVECLERGYIYTVCEEP